jgi:dCTP deaminase
MAIITKRQIIEKISKNEIAFNPGLDKFQLQDHAVDLRLGFTFMIPKVWHLTGKGRELLDVTHFDKVDAQHFDVVELEQGQFFDLLPGEYILVCTLESIKVPNNLMAVLYPRSSTNRKGLSLDLTGIVDSGYEGQLTMPIRNNTKSQTVRLYPGERLCQIVFEELTEVVEAKRSKYHKADIIDGFKREEEEESQLILNGDIKKLKSDFKI